MPLTIDDHLVEVVLTAGDVEAALVTIWLAQQGAHVNTRTSITAATTPPLLNKPRLASTLSTLVSKRHFFWFL